MATAWLKRSDIEANSLPPFCARCGLPSTEYAEQDLALTLAWLDPVTAIRTWRSGNARIRLPLCHRHLGYWGKRWLAIPLSLAVFVALVAGLAFTPANRVHPELRFSLGGLLAVLIPVPIFALMWVGSSGIRVTEASADHVVLTGVSDAFAFFYPMPTLGRTSQKHSAPLDPLYVEWAALDRWRDRGSSLPEEPPGTPRKDEREGDPPHDKTKAADES